jgi:tetratricopeptide (TPR) repeat protein
MRLRFSTAVVAACALTFACPREPEITPQQRADGYYLLGQNEYLQGHFDKALAAFNEAKKYAPNDPRLPAAFGELYLGEGKRLEALAQFEEATRRDPQRATNWSRLGYLQLQLRDWDGGSEYDKAAGSLKRALELNPKDFGALESQAALAVVAGDTDRAVALYVAAARFGPEYRQGDWYLNAAELLEREGRQDAADAVLADAVDAGTLAPEVHARLGERYVLKGDFAAALKAFEVAALHSKDPSYWEMVAELHVRDGNHDQAQQAYQKSLAVEDRAIVHVALAKLAFLRGDREGAQTELDRALSTARGGSIRETLGIAELLIELGRQPQALMLLENDAALPYGERDAELQLKTVLVAKSLGRLDAAAVACARLKKMDAGTSLCR